MTLFLAMLFLLPPPHQPNDSIDLRVWTPEQAAEWYRNQPLPLGCDFIPSTAINQLEMWQEETFDTTTIDIELGYAQSIGFNSIRVFLHYLVWQQNPDAFKRRVGRFLAIAHRHNISSMFVLFDDCWDPNPKLGPQPLPKPGVHNSGWVQCPGQRAVTDTTLFPVLAQYVRDMLSHFSGDTRIIAWDLYNEPGNSSHGDETIPLLSLVFSTALDTRPSQPVTAGIWNMSPAFARINALQASHSDIITFHNYDDVEHLRSMIRTLRSYGKPLVCTEYMRRPVSLFCEALPVFRSGNIGAYNWGLVSGKTQTIYPWDSWTRKYTREPDVWFHDIFRKDGTPYSQEEIECIRSFSSQR
jgi:hypothetical protein